MKDERRRWKYLLERWKRDTIEGIKEEDRKLRELIRINLCK